MAVNYPKTEAVVFGLPAATAATKIQVGSNHVAVKPQFKYVGSIVELWRVQADGGQDKELQRRLCSAGQVFRSLKATLIFSRRVGLSSNLKFYKSLVLPRLMYGAAESWAFTDAQGAQLETFHNGCLSQILGLHRGPAAPPPLSCWPQARLAWLTSQGGTESGGWGTQPASLMMSWSSSCFLRTPSRATLGP